VLAAGRRVVVVGRAARLAGAAALTARGDVLPLGDKAMTNHKMYVEAHRQTIQPRSQTAVQRQTRYTLTMRSNVCRQLDTDPTPGPPQQLYKQRAHTHTVFIPSQPARLLTPAA
jgi:hypothetical protein